MKFTSNFRSPCLLRFIFTVTLIKSVWNLSLDTALFIPSHKKEMSYKMSWPTLIIQFQSVPGVWTCTLSGQYLIGEKKNPVKSHQFFSGDQYFSPTNNFTRLKLTPTKNFHQLFFLLNKIQITVILKKSSDLLYHNLVVWRWVVKGSYKREIYGGWSVKTGQLHWQ